MEIDVVENPTQDEIAFFDEQIRLFNAEHWEVKEKRPLVVQIKGEDGQVVAGAGARTFGDWLLLDSLWVSAPLRGQGAGSALLTQLEAAARQRGCKQCLLNTLDFQAMPFYQKHGYQVQWIQPGYPKTGCKYFMTKAL